MSEKDGWPLWEVFVQLEGGEPHQHAGSIHAPDKTLALQNARDVYGRRGKIVSLWIVPSEAIVASAATDAPALFSQADDKPYRHPQFYKVPRGMKGF